MACLILKIQIGPWLGLPLNQSLSTVQMPNLVHYTFRQATIGWGSTSEPVNLLAVSQPVTKKRFLEPISIPFNQNPKLSPNLDNNTFHINFRQAHNI